MLVQRRHQNRFPIKGIQLQSSLVGGKVVDLGRSGVGVQTLDRVRVGEVYGFKMIQGSVAVPVKAVVRWCRVTETMLLADGDQVPVYRAGLAFSQVHGQGAMGIFRKIRPYEPLVN